MAARALRLRPSGPALALAVALLITGAALAWNVRSHDRSQQARAVSSAARADLTTLQRRIEFYDVVAAGPSGGLAVLRSSEVPAVLDVPRAAGKPVTAAAGQLPAGTTSAGLVAVARTALDVALDTGLPAAAPLTAGVVPVALPLYAAPASGLSTAERRASGTAWRLVLYSPTGLLAGLPADRTRLVGLRVDGVGVGPVDAAVSAGTVLVAGQPWTLYLQPHPAQQSRGELATLLLALLGALTVLLIDLRLQRALATERRSATTLERETRTVATLGPILQSSLDLADVLPAVSLRLVDEFALSHLSLQLMGESGGLREVFTMGSRGRPGAETDVGIDTRADLPAGALGAIPLLRTGRTIGRLTFSGHRALGRPQLAALSAAADLIAAAAYNVELYEREQSSVRRLRELDQLKDAFLGTISHELRTPLTAISGFVRLLKDRWGDLNDVQRNDFMDRIQGNTLSLRLLVDDLLDFARLEKQTLNAPPTPTFLDEQVARILAQLAPVLGERQVRSDLQRVAVLANAGALERVLANLLTNAVKFSQPTDEIVVTVQRRGGLGELVVADTGPGIAPADRERVFTRFFRGESDAARGTRGAGIGLSVVRELVQQMGGTVVALPNQPHGTQMVVRLALDPNPPSEATQTRAAVHTQTERIPT